MLCENCNQNEANVKYTQIINGVKREMHLCDKCANKLGIGGMDFNLEMPIDFSGFFGELLNEYDQSNFMPTIAMPKILSCDKCGLTFDEFLDSGKFGCDNCYTVFESKVAPILKRLHGSNRYVGRKAENKVENNIEDNIVKDAGKEKLTKEDNESKIELLKRELKEKIKEEKYEDAAKLRDEIKKLEKN